MNENDICKTLRAFLQKTVRRGAVELTKKTVTYLILNNDLDWLRKRLATITFEECLPYAYEVSYENDKAVILNHYINITKAIKEKSAFGLGIISFEYYQGNSNIIIGLDKLERKSIKIVSEALKRPKDFWNWVLSNNNSNKKIIDKAFLSYKKASWPWDKAFIISGAYLSKVETIAPIEYTEKTNDFPIWIGLDKHTKKGKEAIIISANKIGVKPDLALFVSFYFSSGLCSESKKSKWEGLNTKIQLKKHNLDEETGYKIWNKLSIKIKERLIVESEIIERELNKIDLKKDYFGLVKEQLGLF